MKITFCIKDYFFVYVTNYSGIRKHQHWEVTFNVRLTNQKSELAKKIISLMR